MQPDLIGGRYRVVRAIGQGGMGTVWLCHDEVLRRDVAVKQVGKLPGESVTDSARALREARSSAALDHRNVVTVFDVVEEPHAIWLVMENVPSRSLAEMVAQEGPLPPGQVADIGAQVADGLAAAHAAGTMHRDVKPGNVLVRGDGLAKISDFGIARNDRDPALTHSGLLTGTPAYFSPQLARGDAPAPADDVWALGATLYAAVEGRPPYRLQRNPVAVLHDIVSGQPPAPGHAGPLEPVLLRMLERDPASRWSMADAAHVLHRIARDHAPRSDTLVTTRPQSAAAPPATPPATPSVSPSVSPSVTPPEDASAGADPGAAGAGAPAPAQPAEQRADHGAPPDGAPSGPPTRPPAGRPGGDPDGRTDRRPDGRRTGPLAAGLLLLLVLALAGGGYLLLHDRSGNDDRTRTSGSSSTTKASSRSSSTSPRPSGSSSGSASSGTAGSGGSGSSPSSSPSSSLSSTAGSSGSAAGAVGSLASTSKATFLRAYFATAPGGSDATWRRLGPGEQKQGRASYDSFWHGIAGVGVSDVAPVSQGGTDAVDATVTYRTTSGSTSRERKRFLLLPAPSGGWLINGERPAP